MKLKKLKAYLRDIYNNSCGYYVLVFSDQDNDTFVITDVFQDEDGDIYLLASKERPKTAQEIYDDLRGFPNGCDVYVYSSELEISFEIEGGWHWANNAVIMNMTYCSEEDEEYEDEEEEDEEEEDEEYEDEEEEDEEEDNKIYNSEPPQSPIEGPNGPSNVYSNQQNEPNESNNGKSNTVSQGGNRSANKKDDGCVTCLFLTIGILAFCCFIFPNLFGIIESIGEGLAFLVPSGIEKLGGIGVLAFLVWMGYNNTHRKK